MKTNLKVILFTSIISAIALVLTYGVCLNNAYGWFDKPWLANEFLLAIFGGVFASTLVVLICEIQKYFLNKKQAEDSLFGCCTHMLIQFTTAKTTLQKYVKDRKETITTEVLSLPINQIQSMINYYNSIEYTTCCKKQTLYLAHKDFTNQLTGLIQSTIRNCTYLVIAINEAKIDDLNKGIPACQVTAENKNIFIVINAILKEFEDCMSKIREFLEKVDYSKRYNVKEVFSNIQKSLDNFQDKNYQDYIQDYKVFCSRIQPLN